MSRPKKLSGPERRVVAERYAIYRKNHPKQICAAWKISQTTMLAYSREFRGR